MIWPHFLYILVVLKQMGPTVSLSIIASIRIWIHRLTGIELWISHLGLTPAPNNHDFKKNFVFEVSISNQPVFCADRGSAKDNSDKRLFWAPEGHEVEPKRAKNLQIAISRSFLARLLFPFMETFYRVYHCLRLKKLKIGETLVLRLEFTVFWASGAVVKNL